MHTLRRGLVIVIANCLAITSAGSVVAQTVEIIGDDQVIWRPAACATEVHGGILGFIFGYEHAGYRWTDDWQRDRILEPVHNSIAEYVPEGDPYFITSRDGSARWYEPRFVAECSMRETWRLGRIIETYFRTKVLQNLGRVVELSDGGGCDGAHDQPVDYQLTNPMYDPYESSPDGNGCSEGGGPGEGEGVAYQPGEYTGGQTVNWATGVGNGGQSVCGDNAKVEYVCIDVYNEETGRWEEWSCGYATTC